MSNLPVVVHTTEFHADYKTDTIIQDSLRHSLGSDVTIITVAHRLQTIMDADKIVRLAHVHQLFFLTFELLKMVLEAGRIVSQLTTLYVRELTDNSCARSNLTVRRSFYKTNMENYALWLTSRSIRTTCMQWLKGRIHDFSSG